MATKTTKTAKLPVAAPVEPASRNGLTFTEEKMLRRRVQQIEAVLSRRGQLGGLEIKALEKLRDELTTRLDPPSVEGLEQRSADLLDPMFANRTTFYWLEAIA
jgi:hypothetical protein